MKEFKSVFQQRFNELLELEKITDAALKTGLAVNTLYAYFYGKPCRRLKIWEGSPPAME